jgi:Dynein heavy chain, N-terminal region 1
MVRMSQITYRRDLIGVCLVHKYNQLMKDFPLNELLSAPDVDKIQEALILIFGHINRKLRLSPYPIRRALPLVEAISRDFNDQLLRILTSHRLLYTPYETFERLLAQTTAIFRTWDDLIKEFTNVAREVTRKRSEKFIPIKVQPAHAKLQERTRYLRDWRKQHEQLAVMTGPTKGLGGVGMEVGGMDMEEEVKEAYEVMKRIDVLDVSTGESPCLLIRTSGTVWLMKMRFRGHGDMGCSRKCVQRTRGESREPNYFTVA